MLFHLLPPVTSASELKLRWLIGFRWFGFLGQLLVILGAGFLDFKLPLSILLTLLVVNISSNGFIYGLLRSNRLYRPAIVLRTLLVADVFFLTAMLFFSGAHTNPFRLLYLVHVALAALLLKSHWKWVILGLSLVAFWWIQTLDFGFVFEGKPARYRYWLGLGEWIAFFTTSAFIAYAVYSLSQALLLHQERLQKFKEKRWKNQKLASLATLSAGAAHELSTPLSTVAIAASELSRQVKSQGGLDRAYRDTLLIRQEVKKCQEILALMSKQSGELAGETFVALEIKELVRDVVKNYDSEIHILCSPELLRQSFLLPAKSLNFVLRSLLKNAVMASDQSGTKVVFKIERESEKLNFEIQDQGEGMGPETLERLGEPFFTTRDTGQGMGLGLFLAHTFADSVGGSLELESELGQGTRARLSFPLSEKSA